MNVSFHSPAPRTAISGSKAHKQSKQHGLDMELDGDHEDGADGSEVKDSTLHVVTPGEVITNDTAFMRYTRLLDHF